MKDLNKTKTRKYEQLMAESFNGLPYLSRKYKVLFYESLRNWEMVPIIFRLRMTKIQQSHTHIYYL